MNTIIAYIKQYHNIQYGTKFKKPNNKSRTVFMEKLSKNRKAASCLTH